MFDIPVALILFRRSDTLDRIISRLREVKPQKVYLLADCGRNEEEKKQSDYCRQLAESLIDWDCEVVKHYADENRGVYKNIGEGAKWVFEREERAIIIEDDNLPEVTFFRYAKELLEKYKDDERIGWICGTNYYTDMESDVSYKFTKHLLPCGWASWSHKFLKLYDGELETLGNPKLMRQFKKEYYPKLLRTYQLQSIRNERFRFERTGKFVSWDFQMLWSIRSKGMYGILPMRNQVTNIGVDSFSIHGGTSKEHEMTDKLCEIPSKPLDFPLIHPANVEVDKRCERMIGNVLCPSKKRVIRNVTSSKIKHMLGFDATLSWKRILKK